MAGEDVARTITTQLLPTIEGFVSQGLSDKDKSTTASQTQQLLAHTHCYVLTTRAFRQTLRVDLLVFIQAPGPGT
mgnify:CR=1 FL=1